MRAFVCACAVMVASTAWAQIELIDPDAPAVRAKKPAPKTPPPGDDLDPPVDDTADDEPSPPTRRGKPAPLPKTIDDDAPVPDEPKKPAPKPDPAPLFAPVQAPPPPSRPAPPELRITPTSDAELLEAFKAWQAANASNEVRAEQEARAKLSALRRRIGASNLETWTAALFRAAATREAAGDSGAAVEIALTAVELSPDVPSSWTSLALIYFTSDPSNIGRYVSAFQRALNRQLTDPRSWRPMVADLASIALLGLIATAVALLLVLLVKHGFYFLYDFHFFFPRAAARWQTAALGVIALSLPLVFRLGVVPVLLAIFAAVTLYCTSAERLVAAVFIALLGVVPTVGGAVSERTQFAGTRAEALYLVDRGGPGVGPIVDELKALAAEGKASFAELSVLGRYELRRGDLDPAIAHLKSALAIEPRASAARVNLGVALMAQGDLENSKAMFRGVTDDDPTNASAPFNLARLYQRRYLLYGDNVAGEADTATQMFYEARGRDPRLAAIDTQPVTKGPIEANEHLLSEPLASSSLVSLATSDAPARITSQLTQMLLGDVPQGTAPFYPAIAAALLVALGLAARAVGATRGCTKCGRPVSHRGDPDVSRGSMMCTQCVNVFAKKNVVAPSQKVRKQLEVARYQSRIERTSYGLGLIYSGMGHVFAGFPVRGAVYGLIFSLVVAGVVLRNGVLRAPYEPLPLVLRLVPLVVIFALVYLLSLRGLRKKQGG
ncbi:MAG: tetratricopeptide repeat protein [Archangium sp.]|nr:tetratricopeptide repeat protein [Archangium sp.]